MTMTSRKTRTIHKAPATERLSNAVGGCTLSPCVDDAVSSVLGTSRNASFTVSAAAASARSTAAACKTSAA